MSDGREPGTAGSARSTTYARRLGVFDGTMLVMGGIVGAGIFLNPSVVAQRVGTPVLTVGVWVLGGVIALAGALCFAELGSNRPQAGEYPYTDSECRGSDPLRDDRRVQKNSCAHYATHDEHGAIEDTEAAGVRGGVGRACRPRFLSVRQLVFQSPRVRGREKSS